MPATPKYAIRVLRRLQDGTVGVFFVDAETGEILQSLDGYEVVSAGGLEDQQVTETDEEQDAATNDYASKYEFDYYDDVGGRDDAFYSGLNDNSFPSAPSPIGGSFPDAPSSTSTPSTPANTPDYGPRLDAYESGYGTNAEYARQQEERAAARSPAASLDDYKTGYGNPYSSPSTEAPEDSLEGRPGLSMTPGSSGERRQEAYYGTKDANFGLDAPTKSLANAIAARTEAEHVNSGFRQGPESGTNYAGGVNHNAEVHGATHSQHQFGNSFDLNLAGLTTKEKQDVISDLGFLSSVTPNTNVNLGFYTGSEVVHVDANAVYGKTKDNPTSVSLMNDRTRTNAYAGIPDWAKEALTPAAIDARAPVPADKPAGMQKNTSVQDTRTNAGRERSFSTNLNETEKDQTRSIAGAINAAAVNPTYNDDDLTNAGIAASYGLSRAPSAAEVQDMAKTFAGELTGQSLRGVANNDPTALAELASMIGSYENRTQSGAENVLSGNNYNSNLEKNSDVTEENYSQFGGALAEAIQGFYSGQYAGLGAPDATHYYSPTGQVALGLAPPSWADVYGNPTAIGPHNFYTAPDEYTTNLGFLPSVQEVGANRVNYQTSVARNALDNSSLLSGPPSSLGNVRGSPISGYYGADGNNAGAGYSTPSNAARSSGGFSVGDVVGSLGGDPSYGGASYGSEYGGSYGGSAPGGGYSIGDIADSLGGGGDNQGGYGGSSGGNNDGYGGGGSLGGGAEGWGQGGGGSSSGSGSSSGNSFGDASTASTGGGTDGYFSGW